MRLTELTKGANIVLNDGYGHLTCAIVAKVNTKWIETAEGKKYNINNGKLWGSGGDVWRVNQPRIAMGNNRRDVMEWDEARELIATKQVEDGRLALAYKMRGISWTMLSRAALEKINAIIEGEKVTA